MTERERGGSKASRHGGGRANAGGDKSKQKKAAERREAKGVKVGTEAQAQNRFLRGARIDPRVINGTETVVQLIEGTFQAYNSGRLREACQLFSDKMLAKDVTVGLTLTGALTPAGLGMSALIPLIEAGFVDWIVSTGANLYHDAHFGLGLAMHRGSPTASWPATRPPPSCRPAKPIRWKKPPTASFPSKRRTSLTKNVMPVIPNATTTTGRCSAGWPSSSHENLPIAGRHCGVHF